MKYIVKAGDSPYSIAKAFTDNGARWPELTRANRQKARTTEGTFLSLRVGEELEIPKSWPVVARLVAVPAPRRELDDGVAWSTPSWEEP